MGHCQDGLYIPFGTSVPASHAAVVAADVLLTTCQSVLDSLERNLTDDCLPETGAALHMAIRIALGV